MIAEELFARLLAEQVVSNGLGASAAQRDRLLTVWATLGSIYLLDGSGEVMIDRDDGGLHPADESDRELAYVQAARRFPELRHLMPQRPAAAETCPRCRGVGELIFNNGVNRACCPDCNTRGWVPVARP
ncbi:hypothetical protein AB0368_33730 [Actinoplanes sp. NPDC051475]|uniref:hypothetical protein n=1 Tax=Actinoplanes sp. NPDC051475 TaxID=3157225 RepID=UPI00344B6A5F